MVMAVADSRGGVRRGGVRREVVVGVVRDGKGT